MKRSLLVVAAFAAVSLLHAQFEKGSILLGGNIEFAESKGEISGTKATGVSVCPSIGVAVSQNLFAGINVIYSRAKNDVNGDNNYDSRVTGGQVFLRRYVFLGAGFNIFGEADAFGESAKNSQVSAGVTSAGKTTSFGIAAWPGISYGATRCLQLEIGMPNFLNFAFSKGKTFQNGLLTEKTNLASFSVAGSAYSYVTLGFRFLIPR
ncbi:MAG TPA: hypothetical protein VGC95_11300 [Chitinophagaceae bacterium]|jgi:hypothetical protein